MIPEPWLYGTAILSGLLYLAAFLYARRCWTRRGRRPRSGDRHARGGDDDPDAVTCPACGADNEPGYRYCRSCVAELPGAVDRTRSRPTPARPGFL